MNQIIWKTWAPPKCKTFAWLVMQNRIWTSDRLQRRGWPNHGNCPLCNQVQESAAHLLFKCRFSSRIWTNILSWSGFHGIYPSQWTNFDDVKEWWSHIALGTDRARKAMAFLLMLVTWEIWKERNARIFQNHNKSNETSLVGPL